MQLKTYRTQNNLTLATIAERLRKLGMSVKNERTVQRHETGENRVSATLVEAYRKATEGSVRFEDWLELETTMRAAQAAPPQSTMETTT